MNNFDKLITRLSQKSGEICSEGYRITGRLGRYVIALKHPNGNRITLLAQDNEIGILKNGCLVKRESLLTAADCAQPNQSANPLT